MKETTATLEHLISTYSAKLKHLSANYFSEKPHPDQWSRKEELGHLIDSAHNNLRRFIVAQYETNPNITYDQNFWNVANLYQQQTSQDLIELWVLLNKQIVVTLDAMPHENKGRMCDTGKEQPEFHSIEWLAKDYSTHLLHHLHHLLDLEPIAY